MDTYLDNRNQQQQQQAHVQLSLLMLMCSDQMATFAHITHGSSIAHILWSLTSSLSQPLYKVWFNHAYVLAEM